MAKTKKESRTYRATKFTAWLLKTDWKQIRGLFMALNMGIALSLFYTGQSEWRVALAVWAMPCLLLEMGISLIFAVAKHGAAPATAAKLEEVLEHLYSWFKVVE